MLVPQDNSARTPGSAPRAFQHVDADGPDIVLGSPDKERIMIAAAAAYAACEAHTLKASRESEIREDLLDIMNKTVDWCREHTSVVRAYFSFGFNGPHFNLEFVTEGEWHDCELDDPMTDFELHLAAAHPKIDLEIRSVPARFRAHAEDPNRLQVYARD